MSTVTKSRKYPSRISAMKCKEIQEKLSAYLDSEIDGDTRSTIERHLAQCAACSKLSERLTSLDEQLRNGAPEPGPLLADRIKNAVFGSEEKLRPGLAWFRVPAFALALVSAIVIGNMMGNSLTKMTAADRTAITLEELTPNLDPTVTDALLSIKDM
jgi:predicted anti-sigma-YlaC factor YlaD